MIGSGRRNRLPLDRPYAEFRIIPSKAYSWCGRPWDKVERVYSKSA